MARKSVLSIQSHVAYGHVGNAAAVFPLQRLGFEVWPVMTVQFSNHTGYGSWRGQVFAPDHVAEIIEGIAERGVLGDCQAIISGYLGEAALGKAVLEAVGRVKSANPDALYLCDPVMGDIGRGFFVNPGIPEFLKGEAVPAADLATPNQFELEQLTGRQIASRADALASAAALCELGPRIVLVTSLRTADTPPETIEMLAVEHGKAWRVLTPLLPIEPAPGGAGDAVAALFLAHYLRSGNSPEALGAAAAAIFAIFEATHAKGARELQLVSAQDAMVAPGRRFTVEPLTL